MCICNCRIYPNSSEATPTPVPNPSTNVDDACDMARIMNSNMTALAFAIMMNQRTLPSGPSEVQQQDFVDGMSAFSDPEQYTTPDDADGEVRSYESDTPGCHFEKAEDADDEDTLANQTIYTPAFTDIVDNHAASSDTGCMPGAPFEGEETQEECLHISEYERLDTEKPIPTGFIRVTDEERMAVLPTGFIRVTEAERRENTSEIPTGFIKVTDEERRMNHFTGGHKIPTRFISVTEQERNENSFINGVRVPTGFIRVTDEERRANAFMNAGKIPTGFIKVTEEERKANALMNAGEIPTGFIKVTDEDKRANAFMNAGEIPTGFIKVTKELEERMANAFDKIPTGFIKVTDEERRANALMNSREIPTRFIMVTDEERRELKASIRGNMQEEDTFVDVSAESMCAEGMPM